MIFSIPRALSSWGGTQRHRKKHKQTSEDWRWLIYSSASFAAVEASPHDLCWANFLLPSQGSELNESPPAECGKDFRLLHGSLKGRRWIINDDIMLRNEIYDALFKSICFCVKSLFSIQVVFLLSSLISSGPPNPPLSSGCWGENNNFSPKDLEVS